MLFKSWCSYGQWVIPCWTFLLASMVLLAGWDLTQCDLQPEKIRARSMCWTSRYIQSLKCRFHLIEKKNFFDYQSKLNDFTLNFSPDELILSALQPLTISSSPVEESHHQNWGRNWKSMIKVLIWQTFLLWCPLAVLNEIAVLHVTPDSLVVQVAQPRGKSSYTRQSTQFISKSFTWNEEGVWSHVMYSQQYSVKLLFIFLFFGRVGGRCKTVHRNSSELI